MCGIAGGFAWRDGALVDAERLSALTEALRRRGPDGQGRWASDDGRVAFGHRRLAIIDPGPSGAQPMSDREGRFVITYNGEIYNHRAVRAELEAKGVAFRTNCDTEVLIEAVRHWGIAGLERLRGMYAFALWDARERTLLLGRDPLGIKPLYYGEAEGVLWFASQARPLVAATPLDDGRSAAALAGFYLWGHVPEPFTWWRGARMLPPGHVLRLEFGAPPGEPSSVQRLQSLFETSARPLEPDELSGLLRDTVAHHLVADTEVGVFLSAGIDSTALALLAAEQGSRLRTVTLAFEEFRDTPDDEAPLAEATARRIGSEHITSWMGAAEFEGLLDDFMASMDQPTVDALNTFCVSHATARAGLKAALSGLGADEAFGGYPSFVDIPKWLRLSRWTPRLSRGSGASRVLGMLVGRLGIPPKAAELMHIHDLPGAYLLRRALHAENELEALLDARWLTDGLDELDSEAALARDLPAGLSGESGMRAAVSLLELSWYMRNQLLRDSDWASMAHGLEVRVPFVDWPLLSRLGPAIASGSPPTKRDLAAACPRFPDAVLHRRKTGFATPVRRWIQRDGGSGALGLKGWASEVHRLFAKPERRRAA